MKSVGKRSRMKAAAAVPVRDDGPYDGGGVGNAAGVWMELNIELMGFGDRV